MQLDYYNRNIGTKLRYMKASKVSKCLLKGKQSLFVNCIKKMFKTAITAFFLYLLISGGYYVYNEVVTSPFFEIKKLEIRGNHVLPTGEIKRLVEPSIGMNIFQVNLKLITDNLIRNPWIEIVTLSRKYPDGLLIEIKERTPFAKIKIPEGENLLIDEKAFLIKKIDNKKYQTIPTILFSGNSNFQVGSQLEIEEIKNGISIIKRINSLKKSYYLNFSSVSIKDDSIILKTPFSNIRLLKRSLEENIKKLNIASKIIQKENLKVKYIDLAFQDQIVLTLL